ncbi:MAG: ArnT family glycosyltransferase [Microcystaceae cyanobacterium]
MKSLFPQSLSNWWQTFEQNPRQCWLLSVIWLLVLSWVAFFWNNGVLGVMDKTEALFVEVAHQMYLTGDWITPRWNGETFFDYPVWGYWLVALSFKLFGVSEWAARLPVALSAIALVVLSFYTLRFTGLTFGERAVSERSLWLRAWLGSGIVAMNVGWVAWGRTSVTDMFLASGIALTLLSFFLGYVQENNPKQQKIWYLIAPIFAGIAVLAKGPVGILLPSLVIAIFLLYVGQFKQIFKEIPLLLMIGIFLIVTIPWYALATQANGLEFLNSFIGFSNFQRFTSVLYRHAGPWYFYLPYCFILLLPWSIFLPNAIARLQFWRRKAWLSTPRTNQLGLFCFFWFMIILLFFSTAATKLAGYILPIVPAGALMITLFWTEEIFNLDAVNNRKWPFLTSAIINTILLAIIALAAFISPQLVGNDPANPNFVEALKTSGLPWILGSIFTLATLLSIFLLIKPVNRSVLWSPNFLGFFLTLVLVIPPLAPLMQSRYQPFQELAKITGKLVQPNEQVFLMGYLRYSLLYYSQHPVVFLDDVPYAIELLQPDKDTNTNKTILIIAEPQFLERFKLQPRDYQLLAQKSVYSLIRVPKATILQRAK